MFNINVNVKNPDVGLQLFDGLYAYRQSLSDNFQSDWQIKLSDCYDNDASLNILYDYMPESCDCINQYDIVLFSNGGEPLAVSTSCISKNLSQPNVYLIANSYLAREHKWYNKVIWNPHNFSLTLAFWHKKFYPQYYQNQKYKKLYPGKKQDFCFINGVNRTTRNYFLEMLVESKLDITIYNNLNNGIVATGESDYESAEDTFFRVELEKLYEQKIGYYNDEKIQNEYYNNSVKIGIDNKFGLIPPGYFQMPFYYDYHCVIYPESTWQNNELCVTEKTCKCFEAQSLPFIIGGANVNAILNELGFQTIVNILPKELSKFDSELDHKKRIQIQIDALTWLKENNQIFSSNEFNDMVNHNLLLYLNNKQDIIAIQQLNNIIELYQ